MIPANLVNGAAVDTLMTYLSQEIRRAQAERAPLEKVWSTYHRAYRAKPEQEVNNFPFARAANLVIPVVATDLDTIYARLMSMYFGSEGLWSVKPLRPDMVDYAPRLEEFLKWAQEHELHMYEPIADWLLETAKLGTGVLKTRYNREQKKVYEFREVVDQMGRVQTLERQARIMIHDCPKVEHVSLWNFYVPAGHMDIQIAPWVGERIMLTWPQVMNRVRGGVYQGIEHLGKWWAVNQGNTVEKSLDRLDSYVPSLGDKFEVHEFWLDYDIDADGEPEAIVATIHLPTRTLMRLDFNPFFNQEKPYDVSRFLRNEKRFYGIGIAEMLSPFQDEISTMHNQRLDNATIANMSMFKALKTGNIKQDEPLFPGRILLVDSMEEIQPLNMGQKFDSTIQNEQTSLQYSQRRSGVNDWTGGGDSPSVNYATATTAVQQLREGAKRIDQTLRENRRCLGYGVGTKVVELYQQYNQGGKPFLAMGEKDGQFVAQILQFPLEIIRAGVLIDVTAASEANNKEVEVRTNIMLMQQITQYYMQLLQSIQIAINPQAPPELRAVAMEAAKGGSVLMRRILDASSVQDIDAIVPDVREILNAGQQQLNPLIGALGGGSPMAQGPNAAQGLPPGSGGNSGASSGMPPMLGAGSGAPQTPQMSGQMAGH